MSSRIRKDRGPPAGSEEQQLWQAIRNTLRTVEKHGSTSSTTLSTLDEVRRAILHDQHRNTLEPDDARKPILMTCYEQLDQQYEEEQREINKALEKLELLIAVRDDTNADPSSKRKKRKTDTLISGASSSSPPLNGTPARDRIVSPVLIREESSLLVAPTPDKDKKRSNSKSNVATSVTTPALQRRGTLNAKDNQAGSNSSNVVSNHASSNLKDASKDPLVPPNSSNYIDPARARREVLAHQLPLQKGRKVAFRQPSKNKVGPGAANVSNMTSRSASSASASNQGAAASQGGAAALDDEGETWIMATIIECINNDRNRYVVQDAEDTAMPTYNTTLKAIVPLPESLTTLPLEDYKVGAQVMGLYPDTSCFYQAVVKGGGPGINGKLTAKMHRKADELLQTYYRLEFEDDGGAIQNVPACLVVERP